MSMTNNHDLFRPETLEANSTDRWGRPVGLLPMAWSRITLLLLLFIVVIIVFLSTVNFSRKETVRGRLRPTEAEARVYVSQPGVLKSLDVTIGEPIEKGMPIGLVSTDRQIESGESLGEQAVQALAEEADSLKDRQAGLLRSAKISADQIVLEEEKAEREQLDARANLQIIERRYEIALERVESALPLMEKGLLPKEEFRRREELKLQTEQAVIDLNGAINRASSRLSELALERASSKENLKRESASIDERLLQIQSQLATAQSQIGYVIKAPISGRVAALQISEGERADPQQPLLTILPEGGQLIAELFVPTRAIAFVEPGQEVRLQYDALPYQKFGAAFGLVESVSATTLSPHELRNGMQTEEAVYRVQVNLNEQSMPAFGKELALQSGMELSADIILEERKLMEWLLEPLMATRQRMKSG